MLHGYTRLYLDYTLSYDALHPSPLLPVNFRKITKLRWSETSLVIKNNTSSIVVCTSKAHQVSSPYRRDKFIFNCLLSYYYRHPGEGFMSCTGRFFLTPITKSFKWLTVTACQIRSLNGHEFSPSNHQLYPPLICRL